MDRLAGFLGQFIKIGSRDRGEGGLRPGRMGQPHQPHAKGIGALFGIKRQHPLMGQRLQKAIQRGLGIVRLRQKVGKPHRPALARNHVQNVQRLADRAVRMSLGSHRSPPGTSLLTGYRIADIVFNIQD